MHAYMPFIVILLALIAAISIGVIAWELSDREFHRSFEQEKRHEAPGRESDDTSDDASDEAET